MLISGVNNCDAKTVPDLDKIHTHVSYCSQMVN